jgi:hypothetical protein
MRQIKRFITSEYSIHHVRGHIRPFDWPANIQYAYFRWSHLVQGWWLGLFHMYTQKYNSCLSSNTCYSFLKIYIIDLQVVSSLKSGVEVQNLSQSWQSTLGQLWLCTVHLPPTVPVPSTWSQVAVQHYSWWSITCQQFVAHYWCHCIQTDSGLLEPAELKHVLTHILPCTACIMTANWLSHVKDILKCWVTHLDWQLEQSLLWQRVCIAT